MSIMTEQIKSAPVEKKETKPAVEMTQDRPVFSPVTDIYENKESILVVCDMPDVDEKGVDVTLEDEVLTLVGHQGAQDTKEHQLLHRGYDTGIFRRSFTLSADVDREKIKARIAGGVLHLTIPKTAKTQPRKIPVEAGS
ncbi:MAG: Hsp20/alpha crystallin family protein [Lentisphaerota bacterium]